MTLDIMKSIETTSQHIGVICKVSILFLHLIGAEEHLMQSFIATFEINTFSYVWKSGR